MKPRYAPIWWRLLAAFLDAAALFVSLPFLFAVPAGSSSTWIGIYSLVLVTLFFNYFAFCEWRWGRTIGKAALGIEVTTETGDRPSWTAAATRNIFRIIDLPLTLLGIGAVLWRRDPQRRRLGDRAAHTVVVRRSRAAAPAGGAGKESAPSSAEVRSFSRDRTRGPGAGPAGRARIGIPSGTWTPGHVAWGILALLVLSGVEIALVAPFDPNLKSLASKLVAQGLLAATLIAVAFGFASFPKLGIAAPAVLGLRRFKASDLKWAAAAVGIYLVFAAIYAPLVNPHQEDVARDLGLGSSVFGAIAAGVLIILISPISEEIFFRGFVFGGLRHRLSLWPAAITAGTIFGAFHFTGASSVGVVPQLAVLGMLLCWLYEKTGSIWPTILVHVLNNVLAFVVIATN